MRISHVTGKLLRIGAANREAMPLTVACKGPYSVGEGQNKAFWRHKTFTALKYCRSDPTVLQWPDTVSHVAYITSSWPSGGKSVSPTSLAKVKKDLTFELKEDLVDGACSSSCRILAAVSKNSLEKCGFLDGLV
jgi:hypothetical protein